MAKMMRAARLHQKGGPFQVDFIPVPDIEPHQVLVQVVAAGVMPDFRHVLQTYPERYPCLRDPPLPAIYGLDAVGVVIKLGAAVTTDLRVGARVYVYPGLSCGSCEKCANGQRLACHDFTLRGLFGAGTGSTRIFRQFPHAGFSQQLAADPDCLIALGDNTTFEEGVRLGGLGRAYGALRNAQMRRGDAVLVDDATGFMGVDVVSVALGLGASQVFGIGTDAALLEKLKSIEPRRVITVNSLAHPSVDVITKWAGGLDRLVSIRTSGAKGWLAGPEASDALPLLGTAWFDLSEARAVADLASSGTLNLQAFEHERFALTEVNEAIDAYEQRAGGFTNVVVMH